MIKNTTTPRQGDITTIEHGRRNTAVPTYSQLTQKEKEIFNRIDLTLIQVTQIERKRIIALLSSKYRTCEECERLKSGSKNNELTKFSLCHPCAERLAVHIKEDMKGGSKKDGLV